jgi:hypothetical protein
MKGGLYSSVPACRRQARYRFAQTKKSEGVFTGLEKTRRVNRNTFIEKRVKNFDLLK